MARLLYRGCEPGYDVAELQDALNNACRAVGEGSAYGALAVDGAFGPKTHDRVLEFQRTHRLGADGVVGPKTWAGLEAVLMCVPGLAVQRPLGGGGNPGVGQGTQAPAYGKPSPGPDVAGAAGALASAAGNAVGAAWSAASAGLNAWGQMAKPGNVKHNPKDGGGYGYGPKTAGGGGGSSKVG